VPGRGIATKRLAATAPIFFALGDPIRLAIVAGLCTDGPLSTVELKRYAGQSSRQNLTKHLFTLEGAGLVRSERVGRDRQWQVQELQLAAMRAFIDQMSSEWDLRLERLRRLVEEDPD
jgi:DNA-binding transcriptional ArsR family regulator